MQFDDRPGTSFTSKRQVQTEQRKRQQMNVGTLESEDKSVIDKYKRIRPITQDNARQQALQRKDTRSKNIPQSILQDREQLYEEVINAKLTINKLKEQNTNLQTKIKQLEEEMTRVVKNSPSNDSLINPMESYYQEFKPQKIVKLQKSSSAPNTQLIIDLKKQIRKLTEDIKTKDQVILQLQKSSKALKVKELEVELLSYQSETVRLKGLINLLQSQDHQKWELEPQEALFELRTQFVDLQLKCEKQEEELKITQVKCREYETKAEKFYNEKVRKEKLINHLSGIIESLKFRDPEFKKQSKATQNEQMLKNEIDSKQKEINTLIDRLKHKDDQYIELDRKSKDYEREQQLVVDQLERERQMLKDQNNQLKEEIAQQSGRRRTVQSSFLENKLETLPEGPEVQDQKQKKLLPCIQKEDVMHIGKLLKYKLKAQRVPMSQIEKFILIDEEMHTIALEEIHDALQNQPFLLSDEDGLKVARYLVEDNDDKFVEFSMNATASVARVRSILKNLIGNYTLLQEDEENQLFREIGLIFTKYKMSLEDYLVKGKKQQETCSMEDLEEALKYVEATINSQQQEFVMLKNFEMVQSLNQLNFRKLFSFFHYVKEPSMTNLPQQEQIQHQEIQRHKQSNPQAQPSQQSHIQQLTDETQQKFDVKVTEPQYDSISKQEEDRHLHLEEISSIRQHDEDQQKTLEQQEEQYEQDQFEQTNRQDNQQKNEEDRNQDETERNHEEYEQNELEEEQENQSQKLESEKQEEAENNQNSNYDEEDFEQ